MVEAANANLAEDSTAQTTDINTEKDADENVEGAVTLTTCTPAQVSVFRQQDLRDSDFLREFLLGQGSYSVVSAALHLPSSGMVALKQISRHRLHCLGLERQLQWEVNVHRTLRHSNIVRLYSYYVTPHDITLVLEYCPKGTLMQRVHSAPQRLLHEAQAARYARHVARALHYLHSHGILHRDLKLENVVLDRNDVAKLTDFGWSKKMAGVGEDALGAVGPGKSSLEKKEKMKTKTKCRAQSPCDGIKYAEDRDCEDEDRENDVVGEMSSSRATSQTRLTVCGTLDYLSPEMVSGLPYTEKTDVWSLGVMIAEMLTGMPPFYHTTPRDTLHAIRLDEPNLNMVNTNCSLHVYGADDKDAAENERGMCTPTGATTPASVTCTTNATLSKDMLQSHDAQQRMPSASQDAHPKRSGTFQNTHVDALVAHKVCDTRLSMKYSRKTSPPRLSSLARDLVLSMLNKDPTRRPSMTDVLTHPWIQKETWVSWSTQHDVIHAEPMTSSARGSGREARCSSTGTGRAWRSNAIHITNSQSAHHHGMLRTNTTAHADGAARPTVHSTIPKQSRKRSHEI